MENQNIIPVISYSCHIHEYREGEQFVPIHSIGVVLSGSILLNDGRKKTVFKKGELYAIRKNHLLKYIKYPPAVGDFKAITISFDEEMLRGFSMEYGYKSEKRNPSPAYAKLPQSKVISGFIRSLMEYEELLNSISITDILRLKQKEALLLLLKHDPSQKEILFDFSDPYKLDLETFMDRNFHFNVNLDKFAYLTGRSLATFKRDFQKVFNTSPRNWLQQRRLQEAHRLITEKGQTASNIYLDLGFEDLSHFSYAFKKHFGYPPKELSRIN